MIETKVFEIRDRMTCIPALAQCITGGPGGDRRQHIIWHAGFGSDPCLMLTHLQSSESQYEPSMWRGGKGCRTMTTAHEYIEANWFDLKDGQLIDVRVILGEEKEPCESEFPSI